MNNITKKDIKQYLKQIRLLLPISGREERKFLHDFKNAVEEYIESNPNCSFYDIREHFGKPEDIVHDYITALDQFQLCKRIKLRYLIKRVIFIILLLMVVLTTYRIIVIHDAYQQAMDGMASYAVTVIE